MTDDSIGWFRNISQHSPAAARYCIICVFHFSPSQRAKMENRKIEPTQATDLSPFCGRFSAFLNHALAISHAVLMER
jgi:hypothetical protein